VSKTHVASVETMILQPIVSLGGTSATGDVHGVIVIGTSPRLVLDESYTNHLGALAQQIGTTLALAKTFENYTKRLDVRWKNKLNK